MIYDRDLREMRRVLMAMIVMLALLTVEKLLRRDWMTAACNACWVGCCLIACSSTKALQKTRDEVRIVNAMIHRFDEEHEHD